MGKGWKKNVFETCFDTSSSSNSSGLFQLLMESESALFKTAIFKTVSLKADVFKVITFYTFGSPCHFFLTEPKEEKNI